MVRESTAKQKIIDAALSVIRSKGYSATSVDELCEVAGVTKGAFFHHFKSKEDLAIAAADYWSTMTGEFFAHAPYHELQDPLDRVLGYIEFRKKILQGSLHEFTCLVGTMVQEAYDTHPAIRDACQRSIFGHAENLAHDIELAKKLHVSKAKWTAQSLALHTQSVIQGSFILAKACGSADVAAESIDHLKRYVELLFNSKGH
jgi:TetR/AcrR family transcriptional repressor of nem operon